MRLLLSIFIGFFILSCSNKGDIRQFRTGNYKTVLDDSDISSTAKRNDSIQVEFFNKTSDTFAIKWTSNFEYILTKINPKTALDSTPFYVNITQFDENSYRFKAFYKGSNFKQKGTAFKLE